MEKGDKFALWLFGGAVAALLWIALLLFVSEQISRHQTQQAVLEAYRIEAQAKCEVRND